MSVVASDSGAGTVADLNGRLLDAVLGGAGDHHWSVLSGSMTGGGGSIVCTATGFGGRAEAVDATAGTIADFRLSCVPVSEGGGGYAGLLARRTAASDLTSYAVVLLDVGGGNSELVLYQYNGGSVTAVLGDVTVPWTWGTDQLVVVCLGTRIRVRKGAGADLIDVTDAGDGSIASGRVGCVLRFTGAAIKSWKLEVITAPTISYTSSPVAAQQGEDIGSVTPTLVSGDPPTSFEISSGALPSGVEFATGSGAFTGHAISGTTGTHVAGVKARNDGGLGPEASAEFEISDPDPITLSYAGSPFVAKLGDVFRVLASLSGFVGSLSVSPDLPPGIFLDPDTADIGGIPANPEAWSPAVTYTVTAVNDVSEVDATFSLEVVGEAIARIKNAHGESQCTVTIRKPAP